MGDGALRCSLSLSLKVLPDSPDVWAFKPVYDPTFFKFVVPVLGGHEKGFSGGIPFEMHLDPKVFTCPFGPFLKPVDIQYHYGDVLLFDMLIHIVYHLSMT